MRAVCSKDNESYSQLEAQSGFVFYSLYILLVLDETVKLRTASLTWELRWNK